MYLIVGLVAGFLASRVVRGGGFGVIGDIIVGLVGAVIGGWLFGRLGLLSGSGLLGSIVTAFVGAVLLLVVVRLVKRA
ncbi:MAG: GlsB/YeaQ/YmgE family stress response membrane protein [Polyangiaceae bacterium]